MSEADFNITSALFSIKIHRQRRTQFLDFLTKRFCTENFETWTRTVDLIDLIRNQSLDVVRKRNAALFDLYNNFVHEGSETAMNVTMDLQKKLQQMSSALRVDPDAPFDVRLILELQKEAEVLLLTDVKHFISENPFDDSDAPLPGTEASLDSIVYVSYKEREKTTAASSTAAGGSNGNSTGNSNNNNAAPPTLKKSMTSVGRRRASVLKGMFSSSKEGSETKLRVTLEESGALTIYGPSGSSTQQPNVLFPLHLSSVSVSGHNPNKIAVGSGSSSPNLRAHKDRGSESSFSFSGAGKNFVFRFKTDEECRLWHRSFMKQYEHWRKVKQTRKVRRARILQAEIGTEASGGTNSSVDNFQGALRRKASESDGLRQKIQKQDDPPRRPSLAVSASTSLVERTSSALGARRGSAPDVPKPSGSVSADSGSPLVTVNKRASLAMPRDSLISSAPNVAGAGRGTKTPIEVGSSEDSSTSEDDAIFATQGNAVYKAINFDDTPGLADASMYDLADDLEPSSPLGQLYGTGQSSLSYGGYGGSDSDGPGPVVLGDANLDGSTLNAYTTTSSYAKLNKNFQAVSASAPLPKAVPPGDAASTSASPSRKLEEMSDSSSDDEEVSNGGRFVHHENLYDFNGIFQQKLQELMDLRSETNMLQPGQLESVYTSIIRLGEDFVKTALTYGKIIINEKYLPLKHKTIKPSTDMGGVLGGEKYVVHKMLFKFAIDSKGVFRGRDDASAKVAGHELKGLKAYFSVADPELHFPLMALIDYKGFRLIAVSMLPLKSGSLIYGSEDAGATVHARDPKLNMLIENASKRLNLKPHRCGKSDVTVYSPVDLEGHIGHDGRFYLLDFSRVFPPVKPSKEVVGGHLFQYFRGEFVFNWPLFPLCSDAYSRFVQGHDDESRQAEKEHKDEIDAATNDLTGITLSNFARELVAMLEEEVRATGTVKNFRLTEEMHRLGINMRYLGLLVARLGKVKYAKFLVAHMCARLVKIQIRQRLRSKMAELKLAVDEPYRICVTDYLNLVFGVSPASTEHWNNEIAEGLNQRFQLRPRNWNQFPRDLKEYVWSGLEMRKGQLLDLRVYLFEQIRDMTGITFSDTLESLILGANNDFWQQERWCDDTDVVDLGAKVKHLDVMSKARGRVFTLRGEEKQRQGYLKSARQLFLSATESFETALSGSPLDPDLLRNCAITMLRVILIDQRLEASEGEQDGTEAALDQVLSLDNPRVARVQRNFVRALQANPEDPFTHLSYAKFMVLCREFEKAEDHFLESLVLEPNTEKGLLAYSEFLLTIRGQTMESAMFKSRAQQVRACLMRKHNMVRLRPELNQTLIMPRDESSASAATTST